MLRPADLTSAATRAKAAMAQLEQPLNAADARLGDGDTGGMLVRLIDALAAVPVQEDVGLQFAAFGKATMTATGSSLGTVCAGALMAIGRAMAGREAVPILEVGGLLGIARDAMQARGQAALGDKTVVDLIDALASASNGKSTWAEVAASTSAAADETLERFRSRPIRTGRARMFGDRTIGVDDPGMLAFALLTTVLATGKLPASFTA
ncbi:dihydroxyacetone kinase subunit L [Labrys neptuniae]